jgi:hypothetical protein
VPAHDRLTGWARSLALTGRARSLAVALATAASLCAWSCGATPPQAPVGEANRVAAALAGIAEACGESYQQHAFASRPAGLAPVDSAAQERALELARVYVQNPSWIYQGETLRQVVALSVSYLRECKLPGAAALLVSQTAGPAARPRPG